MRRLLAILMVLVLAFAPCAITHAFKSNQLVLDIGAHHSASIHHHHSGTKSERQPTDHAGHGKHQDHDCLSNCVIWATAASLPDIGRNDDSAIVAAALVEDGKSATGMPRRARAEPLYWYSWRRVPPQLEVLAQSPRLRI